LDQSIWNYDKYLKDMGKSAKTTKDAIAKDGVKSKKTAAAQKPVDVSDHLPPLPLVCTVMLCSGFLFVYAFRDVFATGRNIGGDPDQAFLVCFVVVVACRLESDGFDFRRLFHSFGLSFFLRCYRFVSLSMLLRFAHSLHSTQNAL
jgi:hypothetical protein